MFLVTAAVDPCDRDILMSKKQAKATEKITPPDYTNSVTGILLLAALLTSLVIIAARYSTWNSSVFTDFTALLAVSILIAVTDALILKLFNPILKSLSLVSNLIAAYILLMATTLVTCYGLYTLIIENWSFKISDDWAMISPLNLVLEI